MAPNCGARELCMPAMTMAATMEQLCGQGVVPGRQRDDRPAISRVQCDVWSDCVLHTSASTTKRSMCLMRITSTTVMMIVDERGDTVIGAHANLMSATVNAARRLGHLVGGVAVTSPRLVAWSTIVRRGRAAVIGGGDRVEEMSTVVVEVTTAATWMNDVVGVAISGGRVMAAALIVEVRATTVMTSVTITALVWVPSCVLQWQFR